MRALVRAIKYDPFSCQHCSVVCVICYGASAALLFVAVCTILMCCYCSAMLLHVLTAAGTTVTAYACA
eukprot:15802-Heterococcus_DN1.PRE.1